jgi:hypothetical protein
MKAKASAGEKVKFPGSDEQKMSNIVDEMDRFFQSVHADIEDWKFSMEDYGDGTRIFVRFQIHINKTVGSTGLKNRVARDPNQKPGLPRPLRVPARVAAGKEDPVENLEDLSLPDSTGDRERAEKDLASFVELWRHKRDSDFGGEYHKEGAPYLETQAEWAGQKRRGEGTPRPLQVPPTRDEPSRPDQTQ